MDEEGIFFGIMMGFAIIILLLILSMPIKGNFFGYEVQLPFIGWISFGAFAVLALIIYFKHKA